METSLHRELKQLYCQGIGETEVRRGGYRIDAVVNDELIEIQLGSLGALRKKVVTLLECDSVRIVKPIVVRKVLVKTAGKSAKVVSRRASPRRGCWLDLFDDLVHFCKVFPHPRLTLELMQIEIEEWRAPRTTRRRGRFTPQHVILDQHLTQLGENKIITHAADLLQFLPMNLPAPFHTGHLAESLAIPRFRAQRIAYCLRELKLATVLSQKGALRMYAFAAPIAPSNHATVPAAPRQKRAKRKKAA